MREIKFRAWDKENERFIPFYKMGFLEDGSLWYLQEIDENEKEIDPPYFEHTDDWELMQYTGLKDKNGVEIYDGDILYFEPYETHGNDRVVEYIDGAYRGRLIRNGYSELLAECVYETKVIGNVYENPELLEREAE